MRVGRECVRITQKLRLGTARRRIRGARKERLVSALYMLRVMAFPRTMQRRRSGFEKPPNKMSQGQKQIWASSMRKEQGGAPILWRRPSGFRKPQTKVSLGDKQASA